ncbi:MAG: saccharopine dehydrogenase [Deltaproteobacteria bacterium]|nr:saccharopine dehydrogenase [Deltaproteobacteria bacterium]
MIYGAYGFTGRLVVEVALARGHKPHLCGRDETRVRALAEAHGLPWSAVDLGEGAELRAALSDHEAVLHCAGPFSATFRPMADACLETGTHYLDITGEIGVLEAAARRHETAQAQGVVVMPAVGFDVVPTDCTAKRLSDALPGATHIDIAFCGVTKMTSGTARSTVEGMKHQGAERVDGRIVPCPPASMTRMVPFQDKERHCVIVPWGDVSTAFHTTGIPNVRTWTALPRSNVKWIRLGGPLRPLLGSAPVQWALKRAVDRWVKGPPPELRESGYSQIWGQARRGDETVTATLSGPEAYALTAEAAVRCVERVLAGEAEPGFRTPAGAFGAELIEDIEGVVAHPLERTGSSVQ